MFYMDDEKKQKVLKNFKKVINKRDATLVNKDLYYHLNLNCNFDAYFNLEGFRREYAGPEGFKTFVSFFDRSSPASRWIDSPETNSLFRDLNNAMLNYVDNRQP